MPLRNIPSLVWLENTTSQEKGLLMLFLQLTDNPRSHLIIRHYTITIMHNSPSGSLTIITLFRYINSLNISNTNIYRIFVINVLL